MARRTFASVWDALEDTAAQAANMRARSELMIALRTRIEGWKVSQTEAARRLGAAAFERPDARPDRQIQP
jgi:predicted XRE-type DNA-binding protein